MARVFPNADDLNAVSRAQWDAILAGPVAQTATWLVAAARAGNAEAQVVLGQWLLDGHGVARNEATAFHWFERAAAQGHAMAHNMAGRCLEYGWGTPQDNARAIARYRSAADAGLDWGLYNLANMIATGRGTAPDQAEALALYRQAASLGHARSMNMVGRYFEEGLVVERDTHAAFACYRRSAEGGDFRGRFSYASMLVEQGRVEEGVTWFLRIAENAPPAYLQQVAATLSASPIDAVRAAADQLIPTPS